MNREEFIKQLNARSLMIKGKKQKVDDVPKTAPAQPNASVTESALSDNFRHVWEARLARVLPHIKAIEDRAETMKRGNMVELIAAAELMSEMAEELEALRKAQK